MEIEGLVDTPLSRRALVGPILRPGHPFCDDFVNGPAPLQGRNPVGYFDAPVGWHQAGHGH